MHVVTGALQTTDRNKSQNFQTVVTRVVANQTNPPCDALPHFNMRMKPRKGSHVHGTDNGGCVWLQGHFPEAEKDSVIQIASLVSVQGQSHPAVKNIITLNTCSSIVGSEVSTAIMSDVPEGVCCSDITCLIRMI